MKIFNIAVALSLAGSIAASPVPAIKWVTEYHYTTVTVGYDAYTAYLASSSKYGLQNNAVATAASPTTAAVETTSTDAATEEQKTSQEAVQTATPSTSSVATTLQAQTSTSSSDSLATGSTYSGEGTYYDPDMGACGQVNSASDYIVALSHDLFDEYTPNGNPNKNTLCGKKLRATYEGKSVDVSVVDRCVGCARYDLDLSPTAFAEIADQALGRIDLEWQWLE